MFVLDERLKNDTCLMGDLPQCRVLLMNDSRYPWLILVPRQTDISEVFQLSAPQQQTLWQETTQVAHALNTLFAADKMNIATLGNVVNQLHMHVVARMRNDAAWPAPVWGKGTAEPYSAEQIQLLRKQIGKILGENFVAQEETA